MAHQAQTLALKDAGAEASATGTLPPASNSLKKGPWPVGSDNLGPLVSHPAQDRTDLGTLVSDPGRDRTDVCHLGRSPGQDRTDLGPHRRPRTFPNKFSASP